jgi:phosphate transport system permease protein
VAHKTAPDKPQEGGRDGVKPSCYWLNSLSEPTASLSILIYNFSSMPFENQIELAWAASLVLVLIVLVFNILSRFAGRARM